MSKAIGPKVYLHTRHMYHAVETRKSFWTENVSPLNGISLFVEPVRSFIEKDLFVMVTGMTMKDEGVRPGVKLWQSATCYSVLVPHCRAITYNGLLCTYCDLPIEKERNKFGSQAGLRTQRPIKWCVLLFHV